MREGGASPDVVLVATGSEVGLACKSAEALAEKKLQARVVSMPSLELFAAQPAAYREQVIPKNGPPVVAVEAGRAASFLPFVGTTGLIYGIQTFGASAPAGDLAEKFGFTPAKLTAAVLSHLDA